MGTSVDIHALEQLATAVAGGLGYDLVDLEWKHEHGHWTLRVLIDFPWFQRLPSLPSLPRQAAGEAERSVSLADCARVSHTLGAEIDVADAIHVPFHLEVSSPGLDRPLKHEDDFRRFAGHQARVRVRTPMHDPHSSTERRNFAGRLVGAEAGRVKITVDGQLFEIPVADVEKANLVPSF